MSIVSNFIGSISPEMFGDGVRNAVQSFDLSDTTFSDMLEKQINATSAQEKTDVTNSFGQQAGINILDLTGDAFTQTGLQNNLNMREGEDMLKPIKPVNESENSFFRNMDNPSEMSTSEVVTFFSSLFDSKPTLTDTSTSGLFDFERKIAAGRYDKYAKNVVMGLSEFVTDTMKIKTDAE